MLNTTLAFSNVIARVISQNYVPDPVSYFSDYHSEPRVKRFFQVSHVCAGPKALDSPLLPFQTISREELD